MNNERDNFLYCFIGTNRCGKSLTARKHIIAWKQANPGRLVIGYDPQKRFRDLLDVLIDPEDSEWCLKLHRFRNALIVIDEFRQLNEHGLPVKGLRTLLTQRCDWNLDIITIFHNPSLVINAISDVATHYFIFLTHTKEGAFQAKIPNYVLCIIASKEVNRYVSIFGRGTYPECDFPHIIVDGEKQKLRAIHMTNKTIK